jgi:mannitol-1-phosphate 5-dehydrogenase
MKQDHVFAGFGFGPIQASIFARAASLAPAFSEIVVAEIDSALVDAVRSNGNRYTLNVATSSCVEVEEITSVALLDPVQAGDASRLADCLDRGTDLVTALPSVTLYAAGGNHSVSNRIATGLATDRGSGTVVYAAENHIRAAQTLQSTVETAASAPGRPCRFVNTVLSKMSRVVTDPAEIKSTRLVPLAPGLDRAYLVEAYDTILTQQVSSEGFEPGIQSFVEKMDLYPFEEAKLFGHNAVHALLGYIGHHFGLTQLPQVLDRPRVPEVARNALLEEVGPALISKFRDTGDPLFTEDGYRERVSDILERIGNPFLADTVARAIRDPARKLGYEDRIIGPMRLAMANGTEPRNLAVAGAAAVRAWTEDPPERFGKDELADRLRTLWGEDNFADSGEALVSLIFDAQETLCGLS